MRKLGFLMFFMLIALFTLSSVALTINNELKFNDVPENHWAFREIHTLRTLNITNGIGNNQFGLGQAIKRGEFVTLLAKLLKWELVYPEEGSFDDNLDTGKWYYAPIETALKNGAILKDADLFRVNEPINREEIAMMMVRALGFDSVAKQIDDLDCVFKDITENSGYITIFKDFGIINEVENNLFNPHNTVKREEAAVMMILMYEKLNAPLNDLHAFYSISSANQESMIQDLNSVGFGWSRLEYDKASNQVILNTTRMNKNEYAVPTGFISPLSVANENNVATQLMVSLKNDTIFNSSTMQNDSLAEYILSNPKIRKQVISDITSHINATSVDDTTIMFDGVVIDFENMKGEILKQYFNLFLSELKQELSKINKLLYVAVHPARGSGQAYYDAYDYKTIGTISDKVILMAHDYYAKQLTEADMQSGFTITPLTPIEEIYYALKVITASETGVEDLNKILLQISFDSVQWKLKENKIINKYPYYPMYDAIERRLITEGVTIHYSNIYHNPYATFYDDNDETNNVLWYEDSRSIQAKIDLAKMFGIRGLSIWRLGNIPDYEQDSSLNTYLDVWQQILLNYNNHNSNVEITLVYGDVVPELKLCVKYLGTNKTLVLDGFSADVFPNGDIIYVGNDLSLRKVTQDGTEEVILQKEQANAKVFLNQDASMAVYTKPKDFEGGEIPFTNGVAVYNFNTNTEKVLLIEDGITISQFGWLGDKILVKYSAKEYFELFLLDLDGNMTKLNTQNPLPRSTRMGLRNSNGRYLAYESVEGNVIVVDLTTGSDTRIDNAKDPQWTNEGLKVSQDGGYAVYKFE